MQEQTKNAILYDLFYTPANPAGFGSVEDLYLAAKPKGVKISRAYIRKWLLEQDAYTLHKQRKIRFKRRKRVVPGLNYQLQADLVDLSSLKRQNNNKKFILTVIDVFSRFAYAIAIRNKTSQEVLNAFKQILETPPKIKLLQVDDGKEFWNGPVRDFMAKNNIKMFSTGSGMKASIVERFNRTLKTRMFKYLTAKQTLRYIDVLQDLVASYNSRKHRSIGIAPKNVNTNNQKQIWKQQYKSSVKSRAVKKKFKVGDIVKISRTKKTFEKGYLPNFTKEVFAVANALNTNPPTYYLRDTNDEVLKGAFYEPELQRIRHV